MEDELKHLANQIHRADSEKESFLDSETIKTLDNGIKNLDQLARRQKNIKKNTKQINQKNNKQN